MEYQRRSGEVPADRRSSGKQKRLHALLPLICLRGLSTGSVSLTLPPLPAGHFTSTSSLHLHPPPPLLPLACRGPCYQARADVRGAHWGRGRGGGGRRRRLIAQQRLPPHRLWEPWTQPSPTRWPPHIQQEDPRRGVPSSTLILKKRLSSRRGFDPMKDEGARCQTCTSTGNAPTSGAAALNELPLIKS